MIKIRRIQSKTELHEIAKLYLDQVEYSVIPISLEACKRTVQQCSFVRCAEYNGKIIGAIAATRGTMNFSDIPVFNQHFCAIYDKGIIGVRTLFALHDAMSDEADRLGIPICISSCNQFDEKQNFAKLLERNSWHRQGHLAIRVNRFVKSRLPFSNPM